MPSSNAFDDSVRCCCWTRRSSWLSSLFIECCFQWIGLTAVVVVHWSCGGGGWPKYTWYLFYTSRYLVLMLLWIIIIGWYSTLPTGGYTRLKVQEIHSCMLLEFFLCPILVYFLRMTLSSFLPFVSHIRGHMGRTPLSSPLPCLPSSFYSRKKKKFRIRFPSLGSPCVELVCIHATYQYNTQHAGCEALSAVSSHTDAFVSGFDLDPNEHIRHFFL